MSETPQNITDVLLGQNTEDVKTALDVLPSHATHGSHDFIYDALKENEIDGIIGSSRPELVVLVGLEDYGKSTFVGSLYHVLRRENSYDGQMFVDSDTFAGFEQKVFLRKCNVEGRSGQKRTGVNDPFLLTLELQDEKTNQKRKIVLSDRSGETYHLYLSNDDVLKNDRSISRADRILFFMDSSALIGRDYVTHHDNYAMLLKRMKNAGLISDEAYIAAVFSKIDKVADADKAKFGKRQSAMIDVLKSVLGRVDATYKIDSKNLTASDEEDGNKTQLWDLMTLIVKPIPSKKNSLCAWGDMEIKKAKQVNHDK